MLDFGEFYGDRHRMQILPLRGDTAWKDRGVVDLVGDARSGVVPPPVQRLRPDVEEHVISCPIASFIYSWGATGSNPHPKPLSQGERRVGAGELASRFEKEIADFCDLVGKHSMPPDII